MSKFCENCGAEMEDNQTVCPNCGNGAEATATETVKEEASTTKVSFKDPETVKKVGIIAGIAAIVVIIIAIIASIAGNGWKAPLKNYVKGMNKCDSDAYLSAYPDFLEMKTSDSDLKDQKKNDEKEYGDNVKYSIKFLKKEKIDKDELKDVQEYIEKKYDKKVTVKKGYKVKVEAKTKGKEDYDYGTSTRYVYKIDGKWKMLNVSPETAKKSKDSKSSSSYYNYDDDED